MKTRSIGQSFVGIIILLVGVGFLLDAVQVWDFSSVVKDWWPLLIIGVGIATWFSNPRSWLWPIALVGAGILLQLNALNIVSFSMWRVLWPAIIIVVGLSVIFERASWSKKFKDVDDDHVDLFVAFSGQQTRSISHNFKGGRANALFGGIELDLRDANIDGQAELNVFTACGGIEIRVPDGWRVQLVGTPILGGWEDNTHAPSDVTKAPALKINATCILGGLSVRN